LSMNYKLKALPVRAKRVTFRELSRECDSTG
jgi:hypothetical protein